MLDIDALRHDIDCRTPDVPPMTRQDVVTWCLINYMAGSRDLFTPAADDLPWNQLADDQLAAATSSGTHPGVP